MAAVVAAVAAAAVAAVAVLEAWETWVRISPTTQQHDISSVLSLTPSFGDGKDIRLVKISRRQSTKLLR